jgi:uncharacterized protein (DUF1810 family)
MALSREVADGPFRHFLEAQAPIYRAVLDELRRGRKESHWMWFVFPQLAGLGRSETSRRFALSSREDAALYAAHPVLGARLRECTGLVAGHAGMGATEIFGRPDDMKFRSSMTLFESAVPGEPLFAAAIGQFFGGRRDELTLDLIRRAAS